MDPKTKEAIERVKKDVRSVLITESGGMLLESFLKIFRQLTNSTIPYRRLGFQSVEEFLLEATDVCRCQRLATGELHLRPVCDHTTSHVLKMVERSRKPKSGSSCRAGAAARQRAGRAAHVPWMPGIYPERESDSRPPRQAGCVPNQVRENILKLVAQYPQGIHLDEFNLKHKDMFGHAITYIGLGFFSIKGMLESIPQLVRLKGTPTGDKVFPITVPGAGSRCAADSQPTASSADHLLSADTFLSYEDSVRGLTQNLLNVLSEQKTAVKVPDLLNLYRRRIGCNLDYLEYGFSSLLSALASLGPPFQLEKRSDDWYVCLRRADSTANDDRRGAAHCPPPTESDACRATNVVTRDDMAAGWDGPPALVGLQLPAGLHADRPARYSLQRLSWLEDGQQVVTETGYPLLEVVITHVRSPGEFFFCLSPSVPELERLEAELAAVYGSAAGRRLQPTDCQLTVGRPLAVRTPAGWRRALLVGRVAEQVKVFLVDTGATLLLSLGSVQILHDKFVHRPTLAHEGTLANLAPQQAVWSEPARWLFSSLVADGAPLMATVLWQSQFVSAVLLCDTRGEADLHVADQLLDAGHAVIPDDLPDVPPAPLQTPDCHLLHDVYRRLGGEPLQSAAQQGRVPPEGAEPPPPAAVSPSQPEPSQSRPPSDTEHQIKALKVQCYDTMKESQAAPSVPKRVALLAKLRRLEGQLQRLQTGAGTTPSDSAF